eukprot:9501672-Alexandrium_andersonii.AAC.1
MARRFAGRVGVEGAGPGGGAGCTGPHWRGGGGRWASQPGAPGSIHCQTVIAPGPWLGGGPGGPAS